MADRLPRKGEAAPLQGDAKKKLMQVLNAAFSLIGFSMLAGLAHKMSLGHSGPAQANNQPAARAGVTPPKPGAPVPKAPSPSGNTAPS